MSKRCNFLQRTFEKFVECVQVFMVTLKFVRDFSLQIVLLSWLPSLTACNIVDQILRVGAFFLDSWLCSWQLYLVWLSRGTKDYVSAGGWVSSHVELVLRECRLQIYKCTARGIWSDGDRTRSKFGFPRRCSNWFIHESVTTVGIMVSCGCDMPSDGNPSNCWSIAFQCCKLTMWRVRRSLV